MVKTVWKAVSPTYRAVLRIESKFSDESLAAPQVQAGSSEKAEMMLWLMMRQEGESLEDVKRRVLASIPKAVGETRVMQKGNLYLAHLMNTEVRFMDTNDAGEIYEEMDRVGQRLGKKYYKIPTGGSNALGSLGYVDCVREIKEQAEEMNLTFHHIICAEGSGGTHAGLALGSRLYMPKAKVVGMMVDTDPFEQITTGIIRDAMKLMEMDEDFDSSELRLYDCSGEGYSIPSEEGNAAIRLMAEQEGIFLDPVYTGKAFAGLIAMAKEGAFAPDENVLFVFSGGAGGLFAFDGKL